MNLEEWFTIGMKREVNPLIRIGGRISIDLGAGNNPVAGAKPLDWPDWIAPAPLPFESETVGTVWAHHFLEHLSGEDAIKVLREIQRVLIPRGVANIVVPYYNSQMQATDPDHKSAWCEETWKNLFANDMYQKNHDGWRMEVNACWIIGIVERNLALFTQLRKKP